jgi:histidinol phosphatase-like PHP family hydrolase
LDTLLDQTVKRLNREPIDIYAFSTYLPANLRAKADELWTERRTTRLIEALLKNQVAIEINSREQLPSRSFIERAKQAGCKFGLGTANETAVELKRCGYALRMVKTCQLD